MDDPWGSTRFEHMLAGRRPRGSAVVDSKSMQWYDLWSQRAVQKGES